MNKTPKLAVLASAAMLLGNSATALADHDDRGGRNADARYDYATVISSQPIVNYVTVTTPVRECWQETQYYSDRYRGHRGHGNGAGTLVGAIIGGVIGHQFGSGRGNDAATVAGTLVGAAIGNESGRQKNSGQYGNERHSRQVERCETRHREHKEERIDGYRVTYRYHGQKYATRMPYDPGEKIRVRIDVRPAR